MTTENKNNENTKLFKYVFLAACFFTFLLIYFVLWPERMFAEEVKNKWNDLKSKSEAHKVIVTSYRDCRKVTFGGSPSECQMTALNYGKARGFKNSQLIFNEIVSLSDEIKFQNSKRN
jgi:hypothetical protein